MLKLLFIPFLLITLVACEEAQNPPQQEEQPASPVPKETTLLTFDLANQYPEGIEYSQQDESIYLGSMSGQNIAKIGENGSIQPFNQEKDAPLGSIGLEIDEANNRLIACYSDRNKQLEEPMAVVKIFNLETGKLLQNLNLASLVESEEYQANDATVTADGSIIISDRKSHTLYQINPNYETSIFYRNEEELHMPNGLDYHPDDYLLVAHSKNGPKLCKFPVDRPEEKQEVQIEDARFEGFDGIVLVNEQTLVGVTTAKGTKGKDALLELTSTDNWKTATITNYQLVNPSTTVALVAPNQYYVLNQDFKNPAAPTVVIEEVKF